MFFTLLSIYIEHTPNIDLSLLNFSADKPLVKISANISEVGQYCTLISPESINSQYSETLYLCA